MFKTYPIDERMTRLLLSMVCLVAASCQDPSAADTQQQGSPSVSRQSIRFVRRWRVNDTLVLEFRQPLVRFFSTSDPLNTRVHDTAFQRQGSRVLQWANQHGHWGSFRLLDSAPSTLGAFIAPRTDTLWAAVALRGKRNYRQVLNDSSAELATPYLGAISPGGDIVHLAFFAPESDQTDSLRTLRGQTLLLGNGPPFQDGYVWDVRLRTWTEFVDSNFIPLSVRYPPRYRSFGFVGGVYDVDTFELPSYWLTRAQAHFAHTHRPPSTLRLAQLTALSKQTTSNGATLPYAYRPLLRRLLQSYQSCPLPSSAKKQLQNALRELTLSDRNPGTTK